MADGAVNHRRECVLLKEVCMVIIKMELLMSYYCASSLAAGDLDNSPAFRDDGKIPGKALLLSLWDTFYRC